MGKYFGTDGIRGIANEELDSSLAYKAGFALAAVLGESKKRPTVFIAKDTRISGDMLECALAAGLCACGADVCRIGVVPTPAAAYLTSVHGADAGIVISASHNPFEHNGIKIFSGTGYKLTDEQESRIEDYIDMPPSELAKKHGDIGTVTTLHGAADEYIKHIADSAPTRLDGMRLLIDCANGASSGIAPQIFRCLGADCKIIFSEPNGTNINVDCGSTHPQKLCEYVRNGDYDLGLAFDGDADRCIACDENGELMDGDVIMAMLADSMLKAGTLRGGAAVTIMSNLGLKRFMKRHGIEITETGVGDRYVLEAMLEKGYNLGGEQSGHVILLDNASTGDGELTGAFLAGIVKKSGTKASALRSEITIFPQVTVNVSVPNDLKKIMVEKPQVAKAISKAQTQLGELGRVVVRPSGTEALVRVMVEGPDSETAQSLAQDIKTAIENTLNN